MEKVIQIEEGRSAAFRASAFSPIQYNRLFPGRDFMRDMNDLRSMSERTQPAEGGEETEQEAPQFTIEDYELFVRVSYTFAYQALSPTPRVSAEQKQFRKDYPDPWTWIDSMNTFSIYQILPEIVDLWFGGAVQVASSKKFEPTVREILTPTYLLRCKQMGFGIEELDLLEYGMILDMMIESGNDTVKYPKKATQAQFREFIGG